MPAATERLYTSHEAARLTGCTVRQVQLRRERGIVKPIRDPENSMLMLYTLEDLIVIEIINRLRLPWPERKALVRHIRKLQGRVMIVESRQEWSDLPKLHVKLKWLDNWAEAIWYAAKSRGGIQVFDLEESRSKILIRTANQKK